MDLRLRPLRTDDEAEFAAIHAALQADNFVFGLNYRPGMAWEKYLEHRADQRVGRNLPDGFVANTFLVADVDGQIVGRASIRHELNEFLATEGGHIGYAVAPGYRRRGYATEILRQSLVIVRSMGIDRVLVTCEDDNIGSATVIERCGGVFDALTENTEDPNGAPKRRYWID